MIYDNEMGNRSLGMYVDHEHVDVAKELLSEIMRQIDNNCVEDGLDDYDAADHVVAGLVQLIMDVSENHGYNQLMYELSVKYGLVNKTSL
jgi:hypothetical protein